MTAPIGGSRWAQKLHRVRLQGKRSLAILSVVFAIYVIGGSYLFGEWWYGFFWDGGYRKPQFISDGVAFLIDHEPRLTLWISLALLSAVTAGLLMRRRLLSFVDKGGWLIIACAVIATSADAIIVRRTEGEAYRIAVRLHATFLGIGEKFFEQLQTLTTPPKIEAPIYFHYLDGGRVEALYNELLPDLVVRQHEVTGSSTVKGKADLAAGTASVGLEAGSDRGSKSVFAPAEFSPDRKCIEVMKYVQEKWPGKYYTSDSDWRARRAFTWVGPAGDAWRSGSSEGIKSALPLQPPTDPEVARQQIELNNKLQLNELRAELGSVGGMVFAAGDFEEAVVGNKATLTLKFSEQTIKCSFRVSIPKAALKSLPSGRPLHLRIFGDVTRPLTDGFVDVNAVAVF